MQILIILILILIIVKWEKYSIAKKDKRREELKKMYPNQPMKWFE